MKRITFILVLFAVCSYAVFYSCSSQRIGKLNGITDTLNTVHSGKGVNIEFYFEKGEEHNYPLMAVWIADTSGNFLQTLYVSESIAKGVFKHGETSTGKWLPGELRRPAALPVWSHSRNIKEDDGLFIPTVKTAIADDYTGATPVHNFALFSKIENPNLKVFDIYFEINQSWDWNDYWTNNKYPGDEDYKTSCQPSLIYKARMNSENTGKEMTLSLVGHGHYSGDNGNIETDLSTITTALKITKRAYAIVK